MSPGEISPGDLVVHDFPDNFGFVAAIVVGSLAWQDGELCFFTDRRPDAIGMFEPHAYVVHGDTFEWVPVWDLVQVGA